MTPFQKRLSPLTKRMAEDMLVRNLSSSTIDSYTYHVDRFTQHFNKPAEELRPEATRQYQLDLRNGITAEIAESRRGREFSFMLLASSPPRCSVYSAVHS